MDSKTVFAEAVKEYELEDLMPKFVSEGWDTFANFAFCVPDFSGKDTTAFEAVLVETLAKDGSQKMLKSRLRRLYAKAYYSTSTTMSNDPELAPATTLAMHKADRVSRTEDLRKRIVGFAQQRAHRQGQHHPGEGRREAHGLAVLHLTRPGEQGGARVEGVASDR